MQHQHLKELWEMRFQKIYDLEQESFEFYKNLLEKNGSILKKTKASEYLKKLMKEEARHAKIARRLLDVIKEKI